LCSGGKRAKQSITIRVTAGTGMSIMDSQSPDATLGTHYVVRPQSALNVANGDVPSQTVHRCLARMGKTKCPYTRKIGFQAATILA
jgi:hypothetical protein